MWPQLDVICGACCPGGHSRLELLEITPDTELDLSTDGERLIITPIRSSAARKKALARAQQRVLREHDETFRKLAK